MNCRNCAAPLTVSVGPARLICSYCQTVQRAPDSPDNPDRLQIIGNPQGVACPACQADQDSQAELVSALIDQSPVCCCPECQGVLIDSTAFRGVVEERRASYCGPDLAAPVPDSSEFARQLLCPSCHRPMEVHPYYGAGRAVIDSCAACRLVWIDQGELSGIERSPGHRERTASPVIATASGSQATRPVPPDPVPSGRSLWDIAWDLLLEISDQSVTR